MRKIILIVLFILISSISYSQDKELVNFGGINHNVVMKTVCVKGYLFLMSYTSGTSGRALSVIQFFKGGILKGTKIPVKCKDEKVNK